MYLIEKSEGHRRGISSHFHFQLDNGGMWMNPEAPVTESSENYGTERDVANCPFFLKTGACRFGDRYFLYRFKWVSMLHYYICYVYSNWKDRVH